MYDSGLYEEDYTDPATAAAAQGVKVNDAIIAFLAITVLGAAFIGLVGRH